MTHPRSRGEQPDLRLPITIVVVVSVATLLWAKWWPYAERVGTLAGTGRWSGAGLLDVGGVRAGDPPSWAAAWSFTTAYLAAVWPALVAALLISAAVRAFLPGQWVAGLLAGRGRVESAVRGGVASTPSMMCTCCAAPVVGTLRGAGVSVAASVAYWLGNPLLNPAVLVFLALVAPWQWTVTRAVVGLLVVVGGAALVARLAGDAPRETSAAPPGRPSPMRFVRALAGTVVVLVSEYLVVVLLVGAFRGWLLAADPVTSPVVLAVVVAAVVGTVLVLPTGGEIPVLQGLAVAGLAAGPLGALLVTLPAASLPGVVMVARSLGARATAWTVVVVVAGGIVGAGLLTALS